MSYNVYLYHPSAMLAVSSGAGFDEIELPPIPEQVSQKFVQRLLKYDYEPETKRPNCSEFIHANRKWSIQVSVLRTEIAFAVPYWADAENAIFEALQTAHELADDGELAVYDPQTGEWSD